MMRIIELKDINNSDWEILLKTSPVATWFQTKEAFCFFESLPFLEAFALGVESEGDLKGVIVGYVQKDGGAIKRFFSRRAIVIGGPVLADGITDDELNLLLVTLKTKLNRKAIYIETRNFNDYSRWHRVFEKCGFELEPHLNYIVDCSSAELSWHNLKENRRRQIKRAWKEGVSIDEVTSEVEVEEFYSLLQALYSKRIRKPLFDVEFFLAFYRMSVGKLFLVKYEGKIIGGIVCPILDNRTIYEWFICGEDFSYKCQYPSVMATWAAIDYANKHGIARFDFMGAGKPNEEYGVRDFKSKFGGELVDYGRFVSVCQPMLYEIGKIGIKLLKKLK